MEKFTPPPQIGIDTNLQFEIFQKKVHPPPRLVLIRMDIAADREKKKKLYTTF